MSDVSFKVSSALKTIIGKELITDRHIAILELVKNSFDANAKRVDISFLNLHGDTPKIVIQDDGDGMSKADILDKWLFLAYSSKKSAEDYRNRQSTGRVFAGAKGIGRFSCDRLGSHLTIYTRKNSEKGVIHRLDVNWTDFEVDQTKEFQTIPANYRTSAETPYQLKTGTVLEITNLDLEGWTHDDLLSLKRKLERLVNPNQGNDTKRFRIFLHVPEEAEKDKGQSDEAKIINGEIKNRIFESLGIKTTQILVKISPDGEIITSTLIDRGTRIFEIDERNPAKALLRNINFHLFHLSQSAKHSFTAHMGMRIFDYGSVFLYKNGFRIHPFGDPGDDRLGIDSRKQQGVFRRLGTRDLAGRIEISGSNPGFKETSSRGDGFIETPEYAALIEFFFEFVLKRLENYVVNFAKFGKANDPDFEKGELPDISEIRNEEFQAWLHAWVRKLTGSSEVTRFEYDPKTIDILKSRSFESASGIVENLERIAAARNDPGLFKQASKARKHVQALLRAKQEAETHARDAEAARDTANQQKEQVERESLFLKSILARDEAAQRSQHLILQETGIITNHAEGLLSAIRKSDTKVPDRWLERLYQIIKSAKKAEALARYSTHANHTSDSDELDGDLITYIKEYVTNVLQSKSPELDGSPSIPITFNNQGRAKFETHFMPIRMMIILDNLIVNSVKNEAKHIEIKINECSAKELVVEFSDDGRGVDPAISRRIFEAGFTTTKGSGLGLYHARQLMAELGGSIVLDEPKKDGATFLLSFKK